MHLRIQIFDRTQTISANIKSRNLQQNGTFVVRNVPSLNGGWLHLSGKD